MYRLSLLLAISCLFLSASAQTCSDGTTTGTTDCTADATLCDTATETCEDISGTSYCCPIVEEDTTTAAAGDTTTAGAATAAATTKATVANTCKDTSTNCAGYTDLCKNAAYQHMLSQKCAKTCKYCKSTDCVDAKTECAAWKTAGFCDSTAYTDATKKAYCGATCAKC